VNAPSVLQIDLQEQGAGCLPESSLSDLLGLYYQQPPVARHMSCCVHALMVARSITIYAWNEELNRGA
jgi:hypothetical protein